MDEAQAEIRDARAQLPLVIDPAFRNRVEVSVLATESDLRRRSDPAEAASAASQAIQLVQQRRDRLRLAQLQLRLAQAHLAGGRVVDARAALDKGLASFAEERAASTELRPISALDESWQLFDASILLSLKEKDYERAFALSEAARSRSVSESRKFGVTALKDVQSSLQAGEAMLAVNQFEDELAVWVITPRSVDVAMRAVSRQTARQLIARQQDEIWQGTHTTAGRDLFNLVVRPVLGQIADASRLIVVLDPTFEAASFAALYNPARNRYLVEDMTVRVVPSASAFGGATTTARGTNGEPLIFNAAGAANADAVASVLPASRRLEGADATRDAFFSNAANRRVVHVAARITTNESYPLLSRFVVAEAPGVRHSGTILGSDIAEHALPNTGLVVIDQAAARSAHRGEGASSLARAFLTAGVPAVVGTLPGADENATRELLLGFHREMSRGASAEQALTTVQRNAVHSNGRRLGAWSALVFYGSDR